jgi:class 3 adenylate cyclase
MSDDHAPQQRLHPLRTAVLMKTDIVASTSKFRALLAADRQSLLENHQAFLSKYSTGEGGRIIRSEGDGYWLEFASVTAAARAAVAMLEALRLAQSTKGDDRLSMRVVIGLGDVGTLDGELIGELLALIVRIESITPEDEIYLTSAARHALTVAEVQTELVDLFQLKGFSEPVPVFRVATRHRTQVIADAYILLSDLRGFTRFTKSAPIPVVEQLLDALYSHVLAVARQFEGTIRFSAGDAHCLTFQEAAQSIAAADLLSLKWDAANREGRFDCSINIALHRGNMYAFRSFLYGEGMTVAAQIQWASSKILADRQGGVFVTSAVRDVISNSIWHSRLQPVAVDLRDAPIGRFQIHQPELQIYQLANV